MGHGFYRTWIYRTWVGTPVTSFNTLFLLKNLFVLSRKGYLQKKTALKILIFDRAIAI